MYVLITDTSTRGKGLDLKGLQLGRSRILFCNLTLLTFPLSCLLCFLVFMMPFLPTHIVIVKLKIIKCKFVLLIERNVEKIPFVRFILCNETAFDLLRYSRETYNALTNWLTDARTLASPNIVIILCGNKKDLDAEREVTFLEASRFAQENELMFLETSALTGENVEEGFLKCARTILNKIDSGELDPERMGSGIQYGDASLRQLRQPRGTTTQNKQQCNC
uniref:RAB4B, member RAS oncogene family n=1 Tax=Poecilia reticulata TaxID=8081 RepID=A0A3P9QJE1_POERE